MTQVGRFVVGRGSVPKVMGIINVSPESFFKGSVRTSNEQIAEAAGQMERDGAHIIDIGAMSTAPYLDTLIPVEQEASRLASAIRVVKNSCDLPVSADTPRAEAAKAAIAAGADMINDVTGLKYDAMMAAVVAKARVKTIVCAYSSSQTSGAISGIVGTIKESMRIAKKSGIRDDDIIIDPSIGFFRAEGRNPFFTKMVDMPWYVRDIQTISQLAKLKSLKMPICVSASRKSFIGHLLNLGDPEDRLAPSIASEIVAAQNGASLLRSHNVRETVQALTMIELLGEKNTKRL